MATGGLETGTVEVPVGHCGAGGTRSSPPLARLLGARVRRTAKPMTEPGQREQRHLQTRRLALIELMVRLL
jgi:hypothetical protein